MNINELLKKVQEIELKTRKRTKQVFSGGYQSAFKGKGMTFTEVKDYQYGDDIRNIDWKVTARFNAPYVKIFEEERELSAFLIIDFSGSNNYGSLERTKMDLILETAAILAFSATTNNDKIGAIFVTDRVEKYIPPKKGKSHSLMILREMLDFKPSSVKTGLNEGLEFFLKAVKRSSICFVISDFYTQEDLEKNLAIANKKHDIIALRMVDPAEKILPKMGLIKLFDAESESYKWVNTNSRKSQVYYQRSYQEFLRKQNEMFRRTGVDYATLSTEGKSLLALKNLFLARGR